MSVHNHTQVHTHIAGYMYQGKFLLWPYNCNVKFPKWFFNINIYIQFNIYLKFWLCFPILQLLLDPSHLHTYPTWCFFLLFQKNPQKNPQKKQAKDKYKRRQTKWNKNSQKYHRTCVVLPNYSWPWVLPQNVFDPPSGSNMIHSVTSYWRKMISPFPADINFTWLLT